MREPDFYLVSSEGFHLEEPRKCTRVKRMRSDTRSDLLLVEIDPPIIGQHFGLGDEDIHAVLIATRHEGESLFPIANWPVYVHVGRLLVKDASNRELVHDSEFDVFAWAELYPTESAARQKDV